MNCFVRLTAFLMMLCLVAESPAQTPTVPAQPAAPIQTEELNAASQLVKEGRVEEALKKIEAAVQKNPVLPPAKLILARMVQQAMPQQYRLFMEQAAADMPDHPEIFITLGKDSLTEGRLSDAILNSNKALELLNSPRWSAEQKINYQKLARFLLAGAFETRADWPNARTQVAAWLDLEPKNGTLRSRYAGILFQLNQVEDAQREFQTAAKDEPNLLPANVMMARQYMVRGDHRKASEFFQKAVTAEPNSARVHIAFADFLVQRGDVDGAKLHTETAARLDPKVAELKQIQGLVARLAKDYAAAEKIFQELYTASPNNINAGIQLALVLAESQDLAQRKRGLEIAEACFRQNNRHQDVVATLGYLYYRNNNPSQAEKIYNAILASVKKPPPDTAYFIALLLADDKQSVEDAKQVLKAALEGTGSFFYRTEAQALYDRLDKGAPPTKPKGG